MEKRRYLFYLVLGLIGTLGSLAQWPMYAAAFFNIGQLYGCDNFRFIAATVCHSLCRSPLCYLYALSNS